MEKTKTEYVIIIGGGSAGLSAAIYLARAGLKPLLYAGSPPGGQLTLTSEVENYPGHTSILGAELIDRMRKQAIQFGTRITDENITSLQMNGSLFGVEASNKSVTGKSVLIATGAKALWLGLESEKKLRGKGVSACATCDGFFFRGKDVAVVGGGDTALEEALTLTKFASKVYIIHRRDSFRASKIMQERVLSNPKISIIWNGAIEEIIGDRKVEGIKIKKTESKENLKVDGVFVAIGHKPDTELFRGKVELDEKGYIMTTQRIGIELAKFKIQNSKLKKEDQNSKIEKMINLFNLTYQSSTSVQGIFAAGDCVDSVYRQASTAVGMGVAASLDIERWLEREK